jgi:CBS domain-containing protein
MNGLNPKSVNNADKFLKIYNKIEKYLNDLNKSDRYYTIGSLLGRLSQSNAIIRNRANDLRELAELRNALFHKYKGTFIAEPYDETIKEIEALYNLLVNPPTAHEISAKNVYTCDYKDLIIDTIKIITEKVYTHIPVYENGKFKGVFSESSIIRWLSDSAEDDGFILDRTKIGELKDYFDEPDDKYSTYTFVTRNASAYAIRDEFLSSVEEQKRIGAVFVTETGEKNEKLLGIITAWDLPKIDNQ